jgi:quercetin dioxygenase-like cupin family protein
MAEKPDNVGGVEVTEAEAGPGHNQPKEVVWERWQKKRTFVRALEGTYGELQQGLMDQPRIYKSKDWAWKGGPQFFDKPIINPQRTDIAQSIETHISVIAPGGTGQRHGHMNSALFYILSGKGYDIHDGKRIDYEAGDVIIVENGCVHQHFNASNEEDLVSLVMKASHCSCSCTCCSRRLRNTRRRNRHRAGNIGNRRRTSRHRHPQQKEFRKRK